MHPPPADYQDDLCVVCRAAVPGGRLPLACAVCGGALHPACAERVERGAVWRDRRLLCPGCARASLVAGPADATGQ